jgi:hypothetical protein
MKAADCVDRTEQRMQGVGWLCGTHCWACLGLDCHEFRMPLQLHARCAAPGKNCQSCLTRDKWWEAAGCVDRAAGPHRAVMGIKRRSIERPVEHACAKHLAPLATDYWAASHSFVEPGHSCVCSKFEKIVSDSEFLAGRMQWRRVAAGMETVWSPSNSKCDSVKG